MEIADYLRIARRRLWILILVPLLAAAAAAAPIVLSPQSYTATATVSTTALVTGPNSMFTGSKAVDDFVGQFVATAQGPQVLAKVAQKSKIPASTIASNLTVAQSGTSANMILTYTGQVKGKVLPVLRRVESETLQSMFGYQVTLAKQQVDNARLSLAAANKAVNALTAKYGTADPLVAYQAQLFRLNSLVQRQTNLTAIGDTSGAAALQPSIVAAKTKLAQFQPIIAQYNALTSSQQAAVTNYGSAQQAYRAAVIQYKTADPNRITYYSQVHPVGKVSKLVHTLIPVVAAAIFVAVVLVMLLELLGTARRSSGQAGTRRDGSAPGADNLQRRRATVPSLD